MSSQPLTGRTPEPAKPVRLSHSCRPVSLPRRAVPHRLPQSCSARARTRHIGSARVKTTCLVMTRTGHAATCLVPATTPCQDMPRPVSPQPTSRDKSRALRIETAHAYSTSPDPTSHVPPIRQAVSAPRREQIRVQIGPGHIRPSPVRLLTPNPVMRQAKSSQIFASPPGSTTHGTSDQGIPGQHDMPRLSGPFLSQAQRLFEPNPEHAFTGPAAPTRLLAACQNPIPPQRLFLSRQPHGHDLAPPVRLAKPGARLDTSTRQSVSCHFASCLSRPKTSRHALSSRASSGPIRSFRSLSRRHAYVPSSHCMTTTLARP